ncbi:WALL-ASSOCIATED RECEPTOR KINASE 2-LIKE [Salix purpurea]|uniref:WALL-ASSOCIATED RECEPTOR KINASE 2-LIKE n=1 Tax=Salix purpurea TaxID=77065 RepID=A0A9Q0WEC9_SALPP|nr:WALL-ASSOCIATED RECEPTOR KINASE 2-LIKE [Salix purpurea]
MSVPYPFGIGEHSCAENEHLFLNCNQSDGHDPEKLWFHDLPVLNISVLEGSMVVSIFTAHDCYNQSGEQVSNHSVSIDLSQGPYMFSDTQNMFTAIGCDTMGLVSNEKATYGAACISLCDEMASLADKSSCSGSGCCQTSIPQGLNSLYISSLSLFNHKNVSDFNPCGYAFLADRRTFKASDWKISGLPDGNASDAVIEWVVETKTCEQVEANTSSYACRNNTNCSYSENGQGYRCLCKDGFTGNPYLPPGCRGLSSDSTASILKQILTSVLIGKGILAKESARTRLGITHAVVHWACSVTVKQVVKDSVSPQLLQLLEELFPL